VIPQVAAPALIAKNVSPPATAVGVALLVVVPLPSWPYVLSPQQYATPPVVSAQALESPTLIRLKLSPPATRVGVARASVVPSPSCPWLLSPQQ
jgi:hypothetical protein